MTMPPEEQRSRPSPSGRHHVTEDGYRYPVTADATADQAARLPAYRDPEWTVERPKTAAERAIESPVITAAICAARIEGRRQATAHNPWLLLYAFAIGCATGDAIRGPWRVLSAVLLVVIAALLVRALIAQRREKP